MTPIEIEIRNEYHRHRAFITIRKPLTNKRLRQLIRHYQCDCNDPRCPCRVSITSDYWSEIDGDESANSQWDWTAENWI
jgi:hypothetical protein